jgi:dipeptidyl aminopeptidase/acylaminoacyl peptidase
MWVYLPHGQTGEGLPCVVIAPAGTRLFHGIDLGEGDKPEHLPYVLAGFAVIAYSIDGWLDDDPAMTWGQAMIAARQFVNADGGIDNARMAMDFALDRLNVDPMRLFVAGHSSAGTLALQVAMAETRVKAAVAYAPATHVRETLGDERIETLDRGAWGFKAWVEAHDPIAAASTLSCRTLVFHAKDDSVVAFADSQRFVEIARKSNPDVELLSVDTGDHYDSMINDGIPAGIRFLGGEFPG